MNSNSNRRSGPGEYSEAEFEFCYNPGVIQLWVSLPWAGPTAYYGEDAATRARRLESLGASGVIQGDHLFVPGPPPGDPVARMAADCLTVLTTVAAHSKRLGVATLVANVSLRSPVPLLHTFANLALLHGGERVYAGIGAGWAAAEFEALGLAMPPHRERLARLTETVELARRLFDEGSAGGLPLAPAPSTPPRLLLGGGSTSLLELAARNADHVDLAPPSHRRGNAFQRPLLTTIDDLEESARAARSAGRALTTSILTSSVVFCDSGSVHEAEEEVCTRVGLEWRPLDQCPYVLIGDPARIAEQVRERRERIGLDWLILAESAAERFSSEVMSVLA
jgi:alkanesulfonate monooxygenase SsuD/methylene tetrahydromethanopterin reductase-like flavin-dependent oxidoreductase (luciferase family)